VIIPPLLFCTQCPLSYLIFVATAPVMDMVLQPMCFTGGNDGTRAQCAFRILGKENETKGIEVLSLSLGVVGFNCASCKYLIRK
jgi:hypothetical protein